MDISSQAQLEAALATVDELMRKGEKNVTSEEASTIRELGQAIQSYERQIYTIPAPTTLLGMIEYKMYEMKLKQKDLAQTLGMSQAKLSLIINGRQKPDVEFLKALHEKLAISGDFLLEHA
ncbi:type II toxin-antitoxin system HigA family antitoxin [Siphonobacter sp. SORGH_AS_1065]|uniref:helix-turn-helix domain-containing protein n=1 Tax=Siphonobacter sp. SORGH_AS_1065 TaxID=3041795 RepID=UPI0027853127|nr:helix-turn-helix domain-containing protein [Siphonobacter sp. SORGH_AS_1065]MDQ1085864.1 HTH-type transcriptional regulator/antitoxin HigA [Siphonobacter sp. SORGH_AS_1065]